MELVFYFFVMILVSVLSFWIAGSLYGVVKRPAIYFPFSLAIKMAFCSVFGALLFMVGGIILSTLVFNAEMKLRPDYNAVPVFVAGAVISIICSVFIYFAAFSLAWQIFD